MDVPTPRPYGLTVKFLFAVNKMAAAHSDHRYSMLRLASNGKLGAEILLSQGARSSSMAVHEGRGCPGELVWGAV